MNRNDLFKKLYSNCNGYVELRAIKDGHVETKSILLGNGQDFREQIDRFCKDYKNRHIYFGIATRDGKGGKEENIVHILKRTKG